MRENRAEEDRCLARVEELFEEYRKTSPVAALIIEPIQSEGGLSSVRCILAPEHTMYSIVYGSGPDTILCTPYIHILVVT